MKKITAIFALLITSLVLPVHTFAHEVYVLPEKEIANDLTVSLNPFSSLNTPMNWLWFLFFAALAVLSLAISFRISYSAWGMHMTRLIEKAKPWGLPIVRVFLGVSLLFSAYYSSLFGPELPLSHIPFASFWQVVLYVAGVLVILGLFTRIVAVLLLILYALSLLTFGSYMLTYVNYLGEIIIMLLVAGEYASLDMLLFKKGTLLTQEYARPLVVPILRLSFALSLFYAAVYVKFLHAMLSYKVVVNYHLTNYFPFDPLFIAFGAGMIEVTIAVIFFLGVNIRWNIFFFAFWATLSLLFFGESVWPHLILFGICIGLFLIGYDQFTLENVVIRHLTKTKKKKR